MWLSFVQDVLSTATKAEKYYKLDYEKSVRFTSEDGNVDNVHNPRQYHRKLDKWGMS